VHDGLLLIDDIRIPTLVNHLLLTAMKRIILFKNCD